MTRVAKERGAKSFEVWRGPSLLTDEPIVAIVAGLGDASLNPKTGAMAQLYFLKAGMTPGEAVRSRDTRAICGECTHAPHRDGTCFVNAFYGPTNLWRSWAAGDCPVLPRSDWDAVLAGRHLRLGAYGDPASAPDELSIDLASLVVGHTGYTHFWRDRPELRRVCMASVTSDLERRDAEARGWRAFQVVPMDPRTHRYLEPVGRDVASCGASVERGKRTTCIACGACGGLSSKARASIVVGAHGMMAGKFASLRGYGNSAHRHATQPIADALPTDAEWGFVA